MAALAPIRNAKVAFATAGSEAHDHLIKFMWYGNGFAVAHLGALVTKSSQAGAGALTARKRFDNSCAHVINSPSACI
jgi:hypothetical protein